MIRKQREPQKAATLQAAKRAFGNVRQSHGGLPALTDLRSKATRYMAFEPGKSM